jgi:hypothetical protein
VKLIIDRYTLVIEPENDQDIAYIEDTLGLIKNGDTIRLERLDNQSGFVLETDESEEATSPSVAQQPKPKKHPNPELAAKFKDFCEASDLEKTSSRNGGETLIDMQARED